MKSQPGTSGFVPGIQLTAIDVGPAMVAAARQRLAGADVQFLVTAFEDLEAADASFDLVVSGAAFHWIDPEVAEVRLARRTSATVTQVAGGPS